MHTVVVLLGPPLGGKGTQAKYLKDMGYFHVDVGDILREKKKSSWAVIKKAALNNDEKELDSLEVQAAISFIQKIAGMAKGNNLDDDFICALVHDALPGEALPENIVFTGFPRSKRQARWLLTSVVRPNQCLLKVVDIQVSATELFKRARERSQNQARTDDTPAIVDQRLAEYDVYSGTVKDYLYRHTQNKKFFSMIDGTNPPLRVAREIFSFIMGIDQTESYCPVFRQHVTVGK